MKKLIFFALLVLPVVMYSAVPTCLNGLEVSLLDSKGKVVKSGKFDSKGELTLDGLGDAVYTIRLSDNGKTCVVNKPTSGEFSGLPTGKRMHKPFVFRMSSQEGSAGIFRPSSGTWATSNKSSSRDAASGMATGKRQHSPAVGNNVKDTDCDDFELRVTVLDGGKVNIQDISITK